MSESTWQLWLSGIEPVGYTDGVFVLSVPNGLIRERVESRYLPMIEDTLANEVGVAGPGAPRGPAAWRKGNGGRDLEEPLVLPR